MISEVWDLKAITYIIRSKCRCSYHVSKIKCIITQSEQIHLLHQCFNCFDFSYSCMGFCSCCNLSSFLKLSEFLTVLLPEHSTHSFKRRHNKTKNSLTYSCFGGCVLHFAWPTCLLMDCHHKHPILIIERSTVGAKHLLFLLLCAVYTTPSHATHFKYATWAVCFVHLQICIFSSWQRKHNVTITLKHHFLLQLCIITLSIFCFFAFEWSKFETLLLPPSVVQVSITWPGFKLHV